jgi:hypothetical protein
LWVFVVELGGFVDFWNLNLFFSGFDIIINGRCDHEQMKSAEGCIVEIIGEYNPDRFLVGTQDTDMRKKFQEVSFFFFFISFHLNSFTLFWWLMNCVSL